MKVLLIEDAPGFAIPIQEELTKAGHCFTWIVGAQRLEDGRIVGIRANPSAEPMGDEWNGDEARLIEIDPKQFDIALSDGGLCGPVNDGVDFINFLTTYDVPCIAITGGAAGNDRLLQTGAIDGLPKEFVVLALRTGMLNLGSIVSTHKASLALKNFCCTLRTQIQQSRASGNRVKLGYPILDTCC